MKYGKLIWVCAALITVMYVAALLFIRASSPNNVHYEQYAQWRKSYVMYQQKHQAFVNTSNNHAKPIALSEGQGYGMYLTTIAGAKGWAKQQNFDDLLQYYLAHRDRVNAENSTPSYLMQWRQYSQNNQWTSDNSSATDGDLYIAYSLHQASTVWPRRSAYYLRIERLLAADILSYEYNSTTHTLTVGDWANQQSHYYNLMRSSDVMPTIFQTLYESTHNKLWQTVSNTMLDRMVNLSNEHATGLIPDFAWVSSNDAHAVRGKTVASKHDGDYSSNACRVPMMLASSNDSRAQKVLTKLLNFFNQQDTITAGYTLTGSALNDYESLSFTAPLVYAANHSQHHAYTRLLRDRQQIMSETLETHNYYDATLSAMAVMEEAQ